MCYFSQLCVTCQLDQHVLLIEIKLLIETVDYYCEEDSALSLHLRYLSTLTTH